MSRLFSRLLSRLSFRNHEHENVGATVQQRLGNVSSTEKVPQQAGSGMMDGVQSQKSSSLLLSSQALIFQLSSFHQACRIHSL